MNATEISNGFANRFFCNRVTRLQYFSDGGKVDLMAVGKLMKEVGKLALHFICLPEEINFTKESAVFWDEYYKLFNSEKPKKKNELGDLKARGDTIALRLAMIFAIADLSKFILIEHIEAAIALVEYSEASWDWVYQQNAVFTSENIILTALSEKDGSCSLTELHALFGRNKPAAEIEAHISSLMSQGKIKVWKKKNGKKGMTIELIKEVVTPPNLTNITNLGPEQSAPTSDTSSNSLNSSDPGAPNVQ